MIARAAIVDPPPMLAVSHGTASPAGQHAIERLVDSLRLAEPGIPVRAGFVDVQEPRVTTLLAAISPTDGAVVVPLLLTAGYHVNVDLAKAIRPMGSRVVVGRALGPDARLATLLARRVRETGSAEGDAVVLAAAGSSDHRAVADCHRMAELLADELGRPVTIGFLSAATPTLSDAVIAARAGLPSGARVVVSTFLLAPGYFFDLARTASADLIASPLLEELGEVPDELVAVASDRYRDVAMRMFAAA